MSLISIAIAILAAIAALVYRRRVGALRGRGRADLTDDMIRRIEERGSLTVEPEEPLDLEQIQQEEERFWEESWDEPDEW